MESLGGTRAVGVTAKPAVSLAAAAGRRRATIEIAQRFEKEGFAGIYCPSFGDGLGLCVARRRPAAAARLTAGFAVTPTAPVPPSDSTRCPAAAFASASV